MNRHIANLLIVIAVLLLALAYRLKREDRGRTIAPQRMSKEPSRWEVWRAGLEIAFSSVAFATMGV